MRRSTTRWREEEILTGRNPVREALLARRRRIHRVMLAEGVREREPIQHILALCHELDIPTTRVQRSDLDQLSGTSSHQGVIAQVSPYPYVGISDILSFAQERGEPPFLLALDCLQDPQNVGALLRTAEAVGMHGVILLTHRAVGITPAVSHASAGAAEHLLVATVTNLARTLEEFKAKGLWVVGVEDHPLAQDYRYADLNMPLVLVLGSEGQGMRRLIAEKCDLLLRIPMKGRIGSLNVSVAGSILMYHAWNARQNLENSTQEDLS
ncbi:MAG: 23S rRNA (guanosine(2251)-2'-O)-methyltransferase RlmB [Chloroflexi bacterium RBG_13_56_8]|nr:MAG: 23S rRNA (guanosine(2251)-2'-O)-methyltransferase RlmB [Chloroflexi bacterium RBG_13_56_8]